MQITRRALLKAIPALAAAAVFPASRIFASGFGVGAGPSKRLLVGSNEKFCLFDLQKGETLLAVDLPFYPHSFIPHPSEPHKIWAIQRYHFDPIPGAPRHIDYTPYTSRAVEVDLRSGKIINTIEAAEGSAFNGHGFFLADDKVLYIARTDFGTTRAYITGYDAQTGKVVNNHAVAEAGIHECKVAGDGSVFFASSGARSYTKPNGKLAYELVTKSGLFHYDMAQSKTISFTPVEEPGQFLGHFCLLKDGNIIGTATQLDYSKHIPPRAYMGREGDKALHALDYNEQVPSDNAPGELFNVLVHPEKNVGIVASLAHNYVILVDLQKQQMVKKIDFRAPWGIQVDTERNEFIVSGDEYIGIIDIEFNAMTKVPLNPNGVTRNFASGHSLLV